MSPRLRVALALALAAALALLGLHLAGLDTGLLFLAPAFALALPLLAGRYPGERVFVRARRRPPRRRRGPLRSIRPPGREPASRRGSSPTSRSRSRSPAAPGRH